MYFRLRNHGTKSDRSSAHSPNTDKTKSVYEHLAVDLEHATTPPPDNNDKQNDYDNVGNKLALDSNYGQPVFTSDHGNSGFSTDRGRLFNKREHISQVLLRL